MGEIGEESMKHMCRFCNKSFPCGRSLGGHMRSHVINSTDHDYQVKKKSCEGVLDKLCKECGKGFQSWKALFGHMKCHSLKNKKIASLNKDSWISHLDNNKSDAKNGPIKRSRSRTSMVSEIEQEQEAAVAMSLMMLSRDKGSRSSKSSVNLVNLRKVEGKDLIKNSSKINKFKENEVGFDFLGRSEAGLIKIKNIDSVFGELKDSNKRNFECVTCDKSFHSHQALCGHKASHQKEPRRDFETKIQSDHEIKHEPVLVHDQTINGYDSKSSIDHQESSSLNLDVGSLKKQKTVVLRAHECPICFKVFTSGQALGGHKRSHFNQENNTSVINKPDELVCEARGFLDLNMLPEEEEEEMNMSSSTMEYKSYCWEDSSNHHSQQSRNLCLLSTS